MNISKKQIEEARKVLENKWEAEGDCGSCGWHGALWEHEIDDWEIQYALENGGELEISCVNKDEENTEDHRGIRINIKP